MQPKSFIKTYNMRRDVFQAIADPTRREILNMVAYQPLNINTVSLNFDVSRAAVYKHLKILAECGLVEVKQKGRERFCEARLEGLSQVSDWVEQYRKFWTAKFDSLEIYLDKIQSKPNSKLISKANKNLKKKKNVSRKYSSKR